MSAKNKLEEFRPQSRNANKHNPRGLGLLENSIRKDGFIGAMTAANDGEIIAGSARLEKSAEVFGVEAEPIVVETDGTRPIIVKRTDIASAGDERAKRLAIADNRVQEVDLTWDAEVLHGLAEFDDLDLGEWFSEKELKDIGVEFEKPEAPEPQTDRAEELREKWGVESGQLWQLGEHRLICGDCTDAEVVARVMGGEKVQLCVTDPPYGIGYDYDTYKDDDIVAYWQLMAKWQETAPDSTRIITMPYKHVFEWSRRFDPSGYLVWYDKTKQSPHSLAYLSKAELIFVFGKLAERYAWDVFVVDGLRGDGLRELHTCPKPVTLFENLIFPQTTRGAIVYDPFLGSGTTLIACERLNRKCRAVEISPAYVAVALERWHEMTGEMPELLD